MILRAVFSSPHRPMLRTALSITLLTIVGCAPAGADRTVTSYEECVEGGNKILKSLPPRCVTPEGAVFVKGAAASKGEGTGSAERKICEDRCGDGVCQEIVCMAAGCPCPESSRSCGTDCPPTAQ